MMNTIENYRDKSARYFTFVLLLGMGAILTLEIALSLNWRMMHDPPILHYIAFLIDKHDYVPYRDTYELSFPGGLLFHVFMGKCFGYGDLAFRLVDIVLFGFLGFITIFIMIPFGRMVAWGGFLIFGLLYFGFGPYMSLQRDYLAIIPVAVAVLLISGIAANVLAGFRVFSAGFLFGLASLIKPHMVIGLIPLMIYYSCRLSRAESDSNAGIVRQNLIYLLVAGCGYLVSVSIPVLWLWQKGGLPAFWEIISSYLPLYAKLNGDHVAVSGTEYLVYLARSYRKLGGMVPLLIPACLGLYIVLFETKLSKDQKLLCGLIAGLAFSYSIYPVLAGKFWHYHWMPCRYFMSLCAALVFMNTKSEHLSPAKRLFSVLVLFCSLLFVLKPPPGFVQQVRGGIPTPPKEGRVDSMADFLKSHLNPGDKVQPLDWTGGSLHAMLLAKAEPATPFIQDFYFYHHVSNPYIQTLRTRFMTGLEKNKPRFILAVHDRPRPEGPDTTMHFSELEKFLESYYVLANEGNGYRILERIKQQGQ